jgi:HSP20 family protein
MKDLIYLFNINTFLFLYTDAFDPLFPKRSLSQVLNLMDQFLDNPFLPAASRGAGASIARRGFDVKEDENGLFICMDMPGLSKEDVKVIVEQNTLVIKGEESKEGDGSGRRRYSSRLELPSNLYKLDGIKGEMKNGVLKLMVPKVKEEERKNVHEVKIE